eukprot:TRINITY_DN1051_c0_g1_i1.p1 TRINITY_DN1051_c0_g1~~TRINITY_DN1051_c0_g1_i1.p1  ORF type:complete len:830 (+),score=220.17 TRINITY_DN1051_c0_g1_i1:180-2669(+)
MKKFFIRGLKTPKKGEPDGDDVPLPPSDARPSSTEPQKCVFGALIEDSMEVAVGKVNRNIPACVETMVTFLRSEGLGVEGIFRECGSQVELKLLQGTFDRGEEPDLSDADVHAVAGLLKQWLRELPVPLIPFDCYESFRETDSEDPPVACQLLRHAVSGLPPLNRVILQYLVSFFRDVASRSNENRMTAPNLGIVFGPNIFRSRDDAAAMLDARIVMSIMTRLIEDFQAIFLEPKDKEKTPTKRRNSRERIDLAPRPHQGTASTLSRVSGAATRKMARETDSKRHGRHSMTPGQLAKLQEAIDAEDAKGRQSEAANVSVPKLNLATQDTPQVLAESLELELDRVRTKLEENESAREKAEAENLRLEAEVTKLRALMEHDGRTSFGSTEEATEQMRLLRQELEGTKRKLEAESQARRRAEGLQRKLAVTRGTSEDVLRKRVEGELEDLKGEGDVEKKGNDRLLLFKRKVEEGVKARMELEEQIGVLEKEIGDLRESLQKMEEVNLGMADEIEGSTMRLKLEQERSRHTKEEKERIERELDQLLRRADADRERSKQERQRSSLYAKAEEKVQRRNNLAQLSRTELESQVEEWRRRHDALQKQNEVLEQEISARNAERSRNASELTREQLLGRVTRLEEKVTEFEKGRSELKADLEQTKRVKRKYAEESEMYKERWEKEERNAIFAEEQRRQLEIEVQNLRQQCGGEVHHRPNGPKEPQKSASVGGLLSESGEGRQGMNRLRALRTKVEEELEDLSGSMRAGMGTKAGDGEGSRIGRTLPVHPHVRKLQEKGRLGRAQSAGDVVVNASGTSHQRRDSRRLSVGPKRLQCTDE